MFIDYMNIVYRLFAEYVSSLQQNTFYRSSLPVLK